MDTMVSVEIDPDVQYPAGGDAFSPSEAYPEYRLGHLSRRPNAVYAMVRRLLAAAGWDAARYGTAAWNPLGDLVPEGSSVFVLCNLVYNRRPRESQSDFWGKCIHGSVLRALVDYLLMAVGESGSIRFGNAPVLSCVWERVLEETGCLDVANFYRDRSLPVAPKDLRLRVAERDALGRVTRVREDRDPDDGVEIDLAKDSLLAELSPAAAGGAPFRVSDYDPKRTEMFHQGVSHRYVVHRAILESDVVFSLSKLKTHEKVGLTCGLKGFVGAVAHKDCLAHHRFGSRSRGGDEYPDAQRSLVGFSRFRDWVAGRPQSAPGQAALQVIDRGSGWALRRLGAVSPGSWYGNDTAWRMALDLARIVRHADSTGRMKETPQRRHLSLIDGIVAGEGDGPLDPDGVRCGTVILSDDVAVGDRVACRLAGFDPGRLPLLSRAFDEGTYRASAWDGGPADVRVGGERVEEGSLRPLLSRPFRTPRGWRGRMS